MVSPYSENQFECMIFLVEEKAVKYLNLKKQIDDKKTLKANSRKKLQEKAIQTDGNDSLETKTVESQTSAVEAKDNSTETLLTILDLDSDIEHLFSGFCKEMLRQLVCLLFSD